MLGGIVLIMIIVLESESRFTRVVFGLHPSGLRLFAVKMSGAAASAVPSKFTAFLNHPAGVSRSYAQRIYLMRRLLFRHTRSKDGILLGTNDEVVFGSGWCEGLEPPCGQTECVTERW